MIEHIYALLIPPGEASKGFVRRLTKLNVVSVEFYNQRASNVILSIALRPCDDLPDLNLRTGEVYLLRIPASSERDPSAYFPYIAGEWSGLYQNVQPREGGEQLVSVASGIFDTSRDGVISCARGRSLSEIDFIE